MLDLHAVLVDGKKSGARIDPRAGVVILDAIAYQRERSVRMSTEYALALAHASIMDRAARNLVGQAQPARVHAIQKARKTLGAGIELLDLIEQLLAHSADQKIFADKAVELMAMHCEMAHARILPHIALIDRHANQMRHQVRQTAVMIAFHPYHFHMALGIGKFANVGEELPMLTGKTAKVEVGKNISEQHQTAIAVGLQHVERVLRPAQLGPQVDVRQDECVVRCANHALVMQHAATKGDEEKMKI